MTKLELSGYCANLLALMSARETAGIARGQLLGREYTRAYDELVGTIRKEEENETRKRTNDVRTEDGAAGREDQRPSGSTDRSSPGRSWPGPSERSGPVGSPSSGSINS